MKICVATVLSIALLLGNFVNLRASATGPVPSDGDGPASQACSMCCQGPAAIPGIPGLPGPFGQPGQKGVAGEPGQKGDIGPTGLMGERGAVGDTGPKGDEVTGPRGVVGPAGETGIKGQKGEPGETPDNSNQRVAFTVVRTSNSDTLDGARLPFQKTKTILPGTSFDLETGTFTCSVPGTYVFMFHVSKYYSSSQLNVHLEKNGAVVVSGYSDDSSHTEHLSGSAVLVLQRGDTVYIFMAGKAYSQSSNHYSSFSGFLLYSE